MFQGFPEVLAEPLNKILIPCDEYGSTTRTLVNNAGDKGAVKFRAVRQLLQKSHPHMRPFRRRESVNPEVRAMIISGLPSRNKVPAESREFLEVVAHSL
jgi:hypothetical protein